jgi:hypothetical protein
MVVRGQCGETVPIGVHLAAISQNIGSCREKSFIGWRRNVADARRFNRISASPSMALFLAVWVALFEGFFLSLHFGVKWSSEGTQKPGCS